MLVLPIFPAITVPAQSVDMQSVLRKEFKESIEKNKITGIAGAVIHGGKVIARHGAGLRRLSGTDPIQADDKFHIGSVSKTTVALAIMRLVERGLLDLDEPISTYLDEYELQRNWRNVTLAQLLVHTSGAPRDFPGPLFEQHRKPADVIVNDRKEAIRTVLKNKPESEPGKKHAYSNVGYTLISHVAEQVTDKSWENLIRDEIFKPLQLSSVGFGPPLADASGEQPWGHRPTIYRIELWGLPSFGPMHEQDPNEPGSDLLMVNRPAGLFHMNMSDLARLGYEFLSGKRGESSIISKKSIEFLLTADTEIGRGIKHANGSLVLDSSGLISGSNSDAYWVTGWNTTFVGFMALYPEQDMVLALSSNDGRLSKVTKAFFRIAKAVSSTLAEPH